MASNFALNPPLFISILIGLTALAAIIFAVRQAGAKSRKILRAALDAQIARESDELDLDKRLGPKLLIEIETIYGTKTQVAYRQTGHGPDILCVHGIGASMLIYRRVVPWLAGDFRLTCIDFPGFGSSDKPRTFTYSLDEQAEHVARTVRALELQSPLVLASSMGGAIVLKTALAEPELFRGIITMAPAVDPHRIPMALLPLAKHGDRFHRMNTLLTVKAVVNQVIARRELVTPALVALYQEPFRDKGDSSSAFLKGFALLADTRMPRLFEGLKTPLLVVRGLRDRLVKQSACEDLVRIVPHATLITHPSAGHHIMEDEPEFIAHETRKFDASLNS